MPIALGIGTAAAGVISGGLGYLGATSAAKTQANAAQNIASQQMSVNKESFAPWMQQGQAAYKSLGDLYGVGGSSEASKAAWSNFMQTPAYNFALQQGNLGLDRSAASKGLLLSGGQLKDLTSFNQGLATQQVGNYTNVLQSMANMGLSASAGYAGQFNQAAGTLMGGANATAAGQVGGLNALMQGVNNGSQNALLSYGLSKKFGQDNNSTGSNPSSYQPLGLSPNINYTGTPAGFGQPGSAGALY